MSAESQQALIRDWIWRHVEVSEGHPIKFESLWNLYNKSSDDKPIQSLLKRDLRTHCITELGNLDEKHKTFTGYKFTKEAASHDQLYPDEQQNDFLQDRHERLEAPNRKRRRLLMSQSEPEDEHRPPCRHTSPELELRRSKRTARIITTPPGIQQAVDVLNRNKSREPTEKTVPIPPPDNSDEDGDDNDFPLEPDLQPLSEDAIAGGGPAPPAAPTVRTNPDFSSRIP